MKTAPLWIAGTITGACIMHLATILLLSNIAGGN
tara:strand:+ start:226691 stop:226792 length:102 start_codon:yes stop_codon:yes gene_type:complete